MKAPMSQPQTQNSVDSFAWQWTRQTVWDTTTTFYRRLFHDAGIWFDHHRGKDIAYVCSGGGRHVWALHKLSGARKIISVELAEDSVALQRSYLKDPSIEIICGDAAEVKFKADFIYMVGCIQHTADPQKTFNRAWENLNDNGEILVSFYMVTPATIAFEPIRAITRRLPKKMLWHLSFFLGPLFMVRKVSRELGFKNARHTAYDWFGSHSYQYYFKQEDIDALFDRGGVHPKNRICLQKGLYRVRKGAFGLKLDDRMLGFGDKMAANDLPTEKLETA